MTFADAQQNAQRSVNATLIVRPVISAPSMLEQFQMSARISETDIDELRSQMLEMHDLTNVNARPLVRLHENIK
jgi:hypothetical protein